MTTSRYRRTGLIEHMTDDELVAGYRMELTSPARDRVLDVVTCAVRGNRRRANHELTRLDRRLAIMRRVAAERGIDLDQPRPRATSCRPPRGHVDQVDQVDGDQLALV